MTALLPDVDEPVAGEKAMGCEYESDQYALAVNHQRSPAVWRDESYIVCYVFSLTLNPREGGGGEEEVEKGGFLPHLVERGGPLDEDASVRQNEERRYKKKQRRE